MEQNKFEYRLDKSSQKSIEFNQSMMINSRSNNVEYIIEPITRENSGQKWGKFNYIWMHQILN